MNRRDLVAALAERTDTDKRSADAALQAFIDMVTETVTKGEPVAITGFAKFARRDVPAKPRRRGRNPATGEEMWFSAKPASKSVKITPLKAFKDTVLTGKVAKKTGAKKTTAKKAAPAKKTTAKKAAPAKKTTAKKSAPAKKTAAKRTARR
jgi:DNA-binding protein HU-beta